MNHTKILVTYATVSGSTQEIAACIADTLIRLQQPVDLRHCRELNSVNGYSAVVIGVPIYMFRLHKDALRFMQRNQKDLAAITVAVFAGGPYGPNAAQDALEVRKNLDAELAKFPWMAPVSVLLVGGRFDATRLRFPYNLIPALKQAPASDARNWEEIRAWTNSLPDRLFQPLTKSAEMERSPR